MQVPAAETSLELLDVHIERLQSEITKQEEQLQWKQEQLQFFEKYRSLCLDLELRQIK